MKRSAHFSLRKTYEISSLRMLGGVISNSSDKEIRFVTNLESPLQVVAGILHHDGRLLVCQRKKEDGNFPLKWEFAGGKVEAGEQPEIALQREMNEELGINVLSATEVFCQRHLYPNGLDVFVRFYRVDRYQGTPANLAFHAICWVEPPELRNLEFLDGDGALVEKLAQGELIKTSGSHGD